MSPNDIFEVSRAELIVNLTEELELVLEEKHLTRKQLAERIGKTPGYVSQLLSGSRNMTLATFSDICVGIGIRSADVLRNYVDSSDAIMKGKHKVNVAGRPNWQMLESQCFQAAVKQPRQTAGEKWHKASDMASPLAVEMVG